MSQPDTCTVCGGNIHMMIYRGTGVCSQLCRKTRARSPQAADRRALGQPGVAGDEALDRYVRAAVTAVATTTEET